MVLAARDGGARSAGLAACAQEILQATRLRAHNLPAVKRTLVLLVRWRGEELASVHHSGEPVERRFRAWDRFHELAVSDGAIVHDGDRVLSAHVAAAAGR